MTTQLSFSVHEGTDDFAHSGYLLSTHTSYLIPFQANNRPDIDFAGTSCTRCILLYAGKAAPGVTAYPAANSGGAHAQGLAGSG